MCKALKDCYVIAIANQKCGVGKTTTSRLTDALLDMVDNKKLVIVQGIDILVPDTAECLLVSSVPHSTVSMPRWF